MSAYLPAETLLVQWLRNECEHPMVQGLHASTEVPASRPARFVTVERTGGGADRFQDFPALAVQCWAQSRWQAEELAGAVREALSAEFRYHPNVSRLNIGGMYNFPDPDSRQARFQLVVDLATSDY